MAIGIRRGIFVGSLIIVCLAIVAVLRHERTFYQRAYDSLMRGTTKADVLKRFGKPGRIGDCSFVTPTWDNEGQDEIALTCVQTFEYFSRISVGLWIIGFDKDGRVVSKAYLSSP